MSGSDMRDDAMSAPFASFPGFCFAHPGYTNFRVGDLKRAKWDRSEASFHYI
jgi:hypothetical protein